MQKISLAKAEKRMYIIIANYIEKNQYPPSMRELAELAGYKSTSTVHQIIHNLIKKGYATMEPTRPRTLKVIKGISL